MAAIKPFTQDQYELIKATTRYNPEDGSFERLDLRSNEWRKINIKPNKLGYIQIRFLFDNNPRIFYAHRIAYLLMTGELDFQGIDHIDGNRANNKWQNIRLATHSQNMRNKRGLGVHLRKCGKWYTQVKMGNKRIYLGRYNDKNEAIEVYRRAHAKVFGEFSPWFKDYGQPNEVEEVGSNMACC